MIMEKVTASLRKTVRSLATPKGRREHGAFIAERTKCVLDLMGGPFTLRYVVATPEWFGEHPEIAAQTAACYTSSPSEMQQMSALNTPSDVIAVFDLPNTHPSRRLNTHDLYLALDAVQDPGNMGTIVRLADWFGVKTILAGNGTVDVFNPKCVMSTMGSLKRVSVVYCDLPDALARFSAENIALWGTFMDGHDVFELPDDTKYNGIIVMGNEGQGISPEIEKLVDHRIAIPRFPATGDCAESLNVAMAAAIILAEFRRPKL